MDDKHVINCNDVPEIDMTRQDGGLEHKAGVYTYQIRGAAARMEIIHITTHLCLLLLITGLCFHI